MAPAPDPSFDQWWQATADLLPRGLLWARRQTSNLGKLVGAIAQERMLRHQRKLILLSTESVPTSAVELLPEWEQAAGRPDPCLAAPVGLEQRWAALADVYFADHPPTPDNMVAWALSAGWNITIREQLSFVAGVSIAGDPAGEDDNVWVVTVGGQVRHFFKAGENVGGDPLWDFPDLSTLECILRRANPGHLLVFFTI
jgi:uncharacterized protein YmfQ (DUF2313 family)